MYSLLKVGLAVIFMLISIIGRADVCDDFKNNRRCDNYSTDYSKETCRRAESGDVKAMVSASSSAFVYGNWYDFSMEFDKNKRKINKKRIDVDDVETGFYWLCQGRSAGYRNAMSLLAGYLEEEDSPYYNIDESLKIYREMKERGFNGAYMKEARILKSLDKNDEYFKVLQSAWRLNDPYVSSSVAFELSHAYWFGIGVVPNMVKSDAWHMVWCSLANKSDCSSFHKELTVEMKYEAQKLAERYVSDRKTRKR
ncbi:MAG: hypothetical protein ACJAUN_000440 [Alcanivorax sp.]|jgi:hypothetical protein